MHLNLQKYQFKNSHSHNSHNFHTKLFLPNGLLEKKNLICDNIIVLRQSSHKTKPKKIESTNQFLQWYMKQHNKKPIKFVTYKLEEKRDSQFIQFETDFFVEFFLDYV
jgi:hypothetical protein